MPTLTVTMNGADYKLPFEGQPMLSTVLEAHGFYISKPCGGRGACGKCIAAMQGAISAPTQAEEKLGVRLVCQTQLLGDASVSLPDTNTAMQIETGNESSVPAGDPFPGASARRLISARRPSCCALYRLKQGERYRTPPCATRRLP